MKTIVVKPNRTYRITRPNGSAFLFNVDELRGRWIYGRASGGYVGSLLRSNVRGPQDPIGPFFTMVEVAA